ncbi:unnamed protein product [Lactuca virosa]|uniref:Uncharacterized protein n=1 Tax=Lactuca virosa TaxID=75947 RepID=A0AAU9PTG7_9ASTR|nr:unnamed protein product [Lactuca virosa]
MAIRFFLYVDGYLEEQGWSPVLAPLLVEDAYYPDRETRYQLGVSEDSSEEEEPMEEPSHGEEMEAEPEETEPNKDDKTAKDSEPMENEVVPPPRPTPLSPYRDILRKAGKTRQTVRKTTPNHRGIYKHQHGLSESMRRSLRDPNWITAFTEDTIFGGRITTRYEDGQSSGVCPPPGDYSGSLALLFDRTLKLEKQEREASREINEGENNTTHVAWRVGRLETQLTHHQNN